MEKDTNFVKITHVGFLKDNNEQSHNIWNKITEKEYISIYNFMFCKEYYAQFENSQNTNYWDYNNKNLDAMVTMETSEVTVYDKELKK